MIAIVSALIVLAVTVTLVAYWTNGWTWCSFCLLLLGNEVTHRIRVELQKHNGHFPHLKKVAWPSRPIMIPLEVVATLWIWNCRRKDCSCWNDSGNSIWQLVLSCYISWCWCSKELRYPPISLPFSLLRLPALTMLGVLEPSLKPLKDDKHVLVP